MDKQNIKVKVLTGFKCKITGETHKRRDIICLPKERYLELKGTFVEKVDDSTALTVKKKKCKTCNSK